MAYVLVKDTFRWNSELVWKLYSQNDSERILQIHVCVNDKLIRHHSKSGAYLIEKGQWLLHTRNFRNQAGRSFTNLTGTTISEYPELWNQLCRLQLPSKILWRILLNFLLVRAELRNIWVLSPLSQRYWKIIYFFSFSSGEIWFGLIYTLELISSSFTWFHSALIVFFLHFMVYLDL